MGPDYIKFIDAPDFNKEFRRAGSLGLGVELDETALEPWLVDYGAS